MTFKEMQIQFEAEQRDRAGEVETCPSCSCEVAATEIHSSTLLVCNGCEDNLTKTQFYGYCGP